MNATLSHQATAKMSWSLDQWLAYLMAIHPSEIDMGLDRVSRVYDRLGISFSDTCVVTVAGTNGKGTTCRFMEMALRELGYTVGVYSSPHISDYRERVRLNEQLPDAQAFCDAFVQIERARGEDTLTYFEFGTLAALLMVHQSSPDYLLLEVGLGGRLDATNIVDPELSVITSIGIDHQEYLGDTRDVISVEKAGIFRPSVPIVLGDRDTPVPMLNAATQCRSVVLHKGVNFDFTESITGNGRWSWHSDSLAFENLPEPQVLRDNIATALAALHQLNKLDAFGAQPERLSQLIATVSLPGRMQRIRRNPDWILDVGHNPHAAEKVAQFLNKYKDSQPDGKLYIIVGMMKDKSIRETLGHFKALTPYWYPVALEGSRAASTDELVLALRDQRVVKDCLSVEEAVAEITPTLTSADTVLVFGSFVTVADLLTIERQQRL